MKPHEDSFPEFLSRPLSHQISWIVRAAILCLLSCWTAVRLSRELPYQVRRHGPGRVNYENKVRNIFCFVCKISTGAESFELHMNIGF